MTIRPISRAEFRDMFPDGTPPGKAIVWVDTRDGLYFAGTADSEEAGEQLADEVQRELEGFNYCKIIMNYKLLDESLLLAKVVTIEKMRLPRQKGGLFSWLFGKGTV